MVVAPLRHLTVHYGQKLEQTFEAATAPEGIYYANGGSGSREFGRQKHPDQFSPLVHVSLLAQPDEPLQRTRPPA